MQDCNTCKKVNCQHENVKYHPCCMKVRCEDCGTEWKYKQQYQEYVPPVVIPYFIEPTPMPTPWVQPYYTDGTEYTACYNY